MSIYSGTVQLTTTHPEAFGAMASYLMGRFGNTGVYNIFGRKPKDTKVDNRAWVKIVAA